MTSRKRSHADKRSILRPQNMKGDGQRVTIETAQGELKVLQSRGRDMLEAIAASQDPSSSAQKVGTASCPVLCIPLHGRGQVPPCNAASPDSCTDNLEDCIACTIRNL